MDYRRIGIQPARDVGGSAMGSIVVGLKDKDRGQIMETPHFEDINVDEAQQFLSAIKKILAEHDINEFYLGREGFVISFDKDWYPFLCRRMGYNPQGERITFPFGIKLLNRIIRILERDAMEEDRMPGGRIFIDRSGVKRKDKYKREIQVCTWDWPIAR